MLEITRKLVEHYLRATGWTLLAAQPPKTYRKPDAGFDIVLLGDNAEAWLRAIAYACGELRTIIAFRLGLCAAAEHEREQLNAIHDRDTTTISREEKIRIDERSRSYQDLLALAGIDHTAWESARKR